MAILARDQLCKRLLSSDSERQIFRPRSWEIESVRGAAYDLRIASDYLILPSGKRFWPDSPEPVDRAYFAAFELKPGDVAFVSSVERLWMPWDLAGNIAPKFRLALTGLLVMGGMLVDPGYGRFRREGDEWVPREEGERLHFQLANVGSSNFKIVPEVTSVAAVQFIELAGDARRTPDGDELSLSELDVPTSDRLLRDTFHPHATERLPQLRFFFRGAEVQKEVTDLDHEVKMNQFELQASKETISWVVVATVIAMAIAIFTLAAAALVNSLS